ncbi:MAG: hypothetical protein K6E92_01435 [Lachnospiraceae bacterium]|nr:hypothetical protein [Lachnospiraceae bacterium]
MNYFVEGLQGSGKSTLVKKLHDIHPEYLAIHEGDYSPVELAWCAYAREDEYENILDRYHGIRAQIEEKSHKEGDHRIICYTQIITDIPGFHKDLEQYEIYHGRRSPEDFRTVILDRFSKWDTDQNIFECSLFQNIVEDMILFQNASDSEITEFYKEIREKIAGKDYRILYLLTEDIPLSIGTIRKERSDEQGKELWFPLMLGYFNESPYARKNGLSGEEAMFSHFRHRQELEISICQEVFPDRLKVLTSKKYRDEGIL